MATHDIVSVHDYDFKSSHRDQEDEFLDVFPEDLMHLPEADEEIRSIFQEVASAPGSLDQDFTDSSSDYDLMDENLLSNGSEEEIEVDGTLYDLLLDPNETKSRSSQTYCNAESPVGPDHSMSSSSGYESSSPIHSPSLDSSCLVLDNESSFFTELFPDLI